MIAARKPLSAQALLTTALLALLLLTLPALAFAAAYPPLAGRVTDAASVLSPQTRAALTQKLDALEQKSGIQLVVATVPSLQDQDVEDYANGLFRFWKLGEAKKNNGVLFLVAPKDRKMRIEVGYGLEGVLTDAVSKIILATAVAPRFKAGDYDEGVSRGVDAIIETLTTDQSEWTKRARRGAGVEDYVVTVFLLALFLFILFVMFANSRGPSRSGYGGYGREPYQGPIVILPPSESWGRDGWGGGSSSGGADWGGGDGGFSGGGGSSGGGGASGDW